MRKLVISFLALLILSATLAPTVLAWEGERPGEDIDINKREQNKGEMKK